jgi:hypothetical protein
MARIVVQCQYTGHYMLTGFDTNSSPAIAGGRIRCPYCDVDHVWSSSEVRPPASERSKPSVRQAS